MSNIIIASELLKLAKELSAYDTSNLPKEVQDKVKLLYNTREKVEEIEGQIKGLVGALQKQMKELEKSADLLEKELLPVIKDTNEKMAKVDNLLVKYESKPSQRPSYQEGVAVAVSKLNAACARIVLDAVEATRKIKESLSIEKTASVKTAGMFSWIKGLWDKVFGSKQKVDEAYSELEEAIKG